jgi:nucleoside-diphosphate-sugar epimerase
VRVFLTGATGYIGSAVALALRERGHDVAALVRPDAEAGHLRDAGVVTVAGDLEALLSMEETVDQYDVSINTAQPNGDPSGIMAKVVDFFCARRPHFIYTSGVWSFSSQAADESTPPNPLPISAWRIPLEQQIVAKNGAVLRPGCVYGGKQSLLRGWFAAADQKQPISIVGDGENHWAMINLHDLADLYVRATEQRASGILHGTDDTSASLNECARALAPDVTIEHAPSDGGVFAQALTVDQRISSEATRKKLGWIPRRTFTSSIDEQWREWRASQRA